MLVVVTAISFALGMDTAHAARFSNECQKLYENIYLKRSGIGAIAIESRSKACGFSYNFETVEGAHAEALKQCRKKSKGRACKIIETRQREFMPMSRECRDSLADWHKLNGFKAFALSPNGKQCGWTSGAVGKRAALVAAMNQCQTRAKNCQVIFYQSGINRGLEQSLVDAGRQWVASNNTLNSVSMIRAFQQQLLENDRDCGTVVLDGKLGSLTYAAIGRCHGDAEYSNKSRSVEALQTESQESHSTELMFRFRSITALVDQLDSAGIPETDRRGIERELSRTLTRADTRTSAKTAFVRVKAEQGKIQDKNAVLSVTIDFGDKDQLVLYPSRKGTEISYWSIVPPSLSNSVEQSTSANGNGRILSSTQTDRTFAETTRKQLATKRLALSQIVTDPEVEAWWSKQGLDEFSRFQKCVLDEILPNIGEQVQERLSTIVEQLIVEKCRATYLVVLRMASKQFGEERAISELQKHFAATFPSALAQSFKDLAEFRKAQSTKLSSIQSAKHEKRIALVIGNDAYANVQPLVNPTNDANDMATSLATLGFEVLLLKNGTREQMDDKLSEFARRAREADTAVVFYAGHAIQHEGLNYLIPVDAKLKDEADVRRLVRVQDVIKDLQNSPGVRILFLDACRDNEAVQVLAQSRGLTRSTDVNRVWQRNAQTGLLSHLPRSRVKLRRMVTIAATAHSPQPC